MPTANLPSTESGLSKTLIEAFRSGHVFNAAGGQSPLHSNISQQEAETLYEIVRSLRPALSVEVGFAQGVSALTILKALADSGTGLHHVIDPFQDRFGDIGLAMAARAGLDNRLNFHRKFAEEVIPGLPRIQFAFVDASHLFDLSLVEFVLIDKKLEVGGVVGFHDMWMPSLQKLLRYILSNRRYEIVRSGEGESDSSPTWRQRARTILARGLAKVPKSDRIFSPDTLNPWHSMQIPNLVLLKKIAEDERDWRFHRDF